VDNPYAGQNYYEQAWQTGFNYVQANPGASYDQPPDFSSWGLDATTTGYVRQIWSEGALAGAQTGQPVHPADTQEQPNEVAHDVDHAVHATFLVLGAVRDFSLPGLLLDAFLAVLIPNGPAEKDPGQDLEAWFAKACTDGGWSEFFVTVAWPDSADQPTWYGHAHQDFESAKREILDVVNNTPAPVDPGTLGYAVAHYRCDSPHQMEVIGLMVGAQ
jgi:hypothetical protein